MRTWSNPSGGVRYHWRAFVAMCLSSRWSVFADQLNTWLDHSISSQQYQTLLLFGASGGYSLKPAILQKFKRVICVDPDPLAQKIFNFRFRRSVEQKIKWISTDFIAHPELLSAFLKDQEVDFVLFSNILGQLPLLYEEQVLNRFKKEFHSGAFRTLPCISYHDRFSSDFSDQIPNELRSKLNLSLHEPKRLTENEIIERIYVNPSVNIDLEDHLTEGFFDSKLPHSYFFWPLHERRLHLIEAVRTNVEF